MSCYISIGTVESWREDADDFPDEAVGRKLKQYPGERFVDITHEVSALTNNFARLARICMIVDIKHRTFISAWESVRC